MTRIHAASANGATSTGLELAIEAALAGIGSPSPEDIQAAVDAYLTANPPSAVVVTDLDNGYLSI